MFAQKTFPLIFDDFDKKSIKFKKKLRIREKFFPLDKFMFDLSHETNKSQILWDNFATKRQRKVFQEVFKLLFF